MTKLQRSLRKQGKSKPLFNKKGKAIAVRTRYGMKLILKDLRRVWRKHPELTLAELVCSELKWLAIRSDAEFVRSVEDLHAIETD